MTLAKPTLLAPPLRTRRVVYPVRDGKPMAETDKHADIMVYCKEALRLHFANRSDAVYVSGNNFVFWQEGDPKKRVSPDVYVVFGIPQRQRDSYKAWEEGSHLPSVVFEITSRKTQAEDVGEKFALYRDTLRVPEYFQFDPTGDYLFPRLQGHRRTEDGRYEPISLEQEDRLYSRHLNLYLVMQDDTLRLFDPIHQRFLPTLAEADERAQAEAERARLLTDENARLRAELEALRKQR